MSQVALFSYCTVFYEYDIPKSLLHFLQHLLGAPLKTHGLYCFHLFGVSSGMTGVLACTLMVITDVKAGTKFLRVKIGWACRLTLDFGGIKSANDSRLCKHLSHLTPPSYLRPLYQFLTDIE